MDIERIIELSGQIRAHRKKAKSLEEQLRQEVGEGGMRDAVAVDLKVARGAYVPAILELLDKNPDRAFEAGEIARRIHAKNENSVKSALSRMSTRNQIRKAKPFGYRSAKVQRELPRVNGGEVTELSGT